MVTKDIVKKRRILLKKDYFDFGSSQSVFLYLHKTYTNIFITMTDMTKKVIICKTSGSSGIKGSKRRKRIPLAIENIMDNLRTYISLYRIKKVHIVLQMRLSVFFFYLVKELTYYNIQIISMSLHRKVPFNGVKGRKLRRV